MCTLYTDYVFDLRYADDAAISSHTASGLKQNLSVLTEAYKRAGLVVNVKNTEVLAHRDGPEPIQPSHFSAKGSTVKNTQQFNYLQSILTSKCHLDKEIQSRIKQVSAAFVGRLSKHMFVN